MNTMKLAFLKAFTSKVSKQNIKSARTIGMALKSVLKRIGE